MKDLNMKFVLIATMAQCDSLCGITENVFATEIPQVHGHAVLGLCVLDVGRIGRDDF